MHADDLDMLDCGERLHDPRETPRRQNQRVAAGEDHLPDFFVIANIGNRGMKRSAGERALEANHFAAEAEAAIDRADMKRLEQDPVGITMHDALERAMRAIPDRVGALLRLYVELGRIGNELARDRVARIGRIDELCDVWGE